MATPTGRGRGRGRGKLAKATEATEKEHTACKAIYIGTAKNYFEKVLKPTIEARAPSRMVVDSTQENAKASKTKTIGTEIIKNDAFLSFERDMQSNFAFNKSLVNQALNLLYDSKKNWHTELTPQQKDDWQEANLNRICNLNYIMNQNFSKDDKPKWYRKLSWMQNQADDAAGDAAGGPKPSRPRVSKRTQLEEPRPAAPSALDHEPTEGSPVHTGYMGTVMSKDGFAVGLSTETMLCGRIPQDKYNRIRAQDLDWLKDWSYPYNINKEIADDLVPAKF